jgi:NAD(P)-dependent dehydrogenase (short-subunit alcohol dehydrogenase family)
VIPPFVTLRAIRSSRPKRSHRSNRSNWSLEDLPSLAGRRAVVTGSTQGIGYQIALALAGAGADVVLAGRSRADLDAAAAAIVRRHPGARVSGEVLDLASLASVRALAEQVGAGGRALDVLVNNAGILAPKPRRVTEDGFEAQFQVNYLGHFLLTALLLPLLRASAAVPRVTHVSSSVHHAGRIAFDDLQSARAYSPFRSYAQSKLANLLFACELQRRGDALGWGLVSTAAHPGIARTNLVENTHGRGRLHLGKRALGTWFTQSPEAAALPAIYAAASPDASPMGYYGPAYLFELKGPVAPARIGFRARNVADARRLWEISSAMANVRFPE